MATPSTWQDLTRRNIDTIKDIFRGTDLSTRERLDAYHIAWNMIKDDRFETVSARWNAFHNALRIAVEALTT